MTDTILLVGHGSREDSGNQEIREFVELWRARQPGWRIEVCFIEFAPPSLHDGLLTAAKGSSRVLVLPLILNAAGHVKMEIPEAIEHAREHCPGTEFLYGPHLTACDPILAILKRRLRKAMAALDMPDPTTTGVVLLGRGSSDRAANGDMAKMARWLMEEGDHELVDLAFTGITWPRLERVVQRQVLLGMRQVVVLPYYLYTGTLMQRIHRQVEHLRVQYPQMRFTCTTHFGFEKEIFELLEQRVADLRGGVAEAKLPCDGCRFREIAHELGHGHSHEHTHAHHAAPAQEHAHGQVVHVHGHHHGHDHAHGHEHHHEQVSA
ncbi:sirohydrochlorin chelatase [Azohydromonas caseinilytica]|uniref:Sirohydrochlorin chelatase n=1 Tax=Azohydromonas caseinilytica TaxID=2728836 RepID=A0A848F9J0_9BURK|nr:sirohydrochlorin chelatase [Azohydromonas caseinilytica]NML16002.1 sirohydrochlorin chelatase [Azohydromonas caseinilytica]